MDEQQLRHEAFIRAGFRCEWSLCKTTDDLRLAHLRAKGMGGSPSANVLSNVACLCRFHHDILDGRTTAGRQREVRTLLEHYLQRGETTE